MIVLAVVAAVYVVMAALRPRAEETVGARRTAAGHRPVPDALGWAAIWPSPCSAAPVMLLLAGLGFGVGGRRLHGRRRAVAGAAGAPLAYAPALWVTAGVAVVLFGWLPRATAAAWVRARVRVRRRLPRAEILDFPDWMNNLSPFGHVPQLPAEEMSWTPLLMLTALAAALVALGLAGFRRRDLETK